ncbi:MAG: saccharopine dehydrogenase NADP-binding domain-containing protein [Deltaproteobacteria bacterium]|nr:saccharopine dehydrogenase NADP-binding domain-containing protein [Deltaproteobacteria bacterium]
MSPLRVYGATGYTGRLIVDSACAQGLRPVLGGRSSTRLEPIAAALGLECRVAQLDDPIGLRSALTDIDVVLHAAGPFAATSTPMIEACLATRTHYLDVSGEIETIEAAACRDRDARTAGVMIMPAVGFDVVPSDGLAAHVHRRLPRARRLRLGVSGLVAASRGSVKTLIANAGTPILVRRGGHVRKAPDPTEVHRFDFGYGPREGVLVSWETSRARGTQPESPKSKSTSRRRPSIG